MEENVSIIEDLSVRIFKMLLYQLTDTSVQYAVLGRSFDTSYPTGGYGVSAGSENRPPMLNKENYVPWSSHLLWYAKSRPNGKIEADNQAIKNIPLGLPEDIYAAVTSCETAQEIWLRVQ
nr:hypothetical protein [Tanacetum cinerariifolium]